MEHSADYVQMNNENSGTAPEPSLRSEFRSGAALPGDGALRFGGRGEVGAPTRTYSFTRTGHADQRADHAGAPRGAGDRSRPVPAPEPVVQPRPVPVPEPLTQADPPYAAAAAASGRTAQSQQPWQSVLEELPDWSTRPSPWQPDPAARQPAPEYDAEEEPDWEEDPYYDTYAAQTPRTETRAKNGPWIAIAVAAALLLGLVAGAFGYQLWSDFHKKPTPAKEPVSTGTASFQPETIYEQNAEAVVGIVAAPNRELAVSYAEPNTTGTGFLISEDGYLLTNYHVVRDAETITVQLLDGRTWVARLVAFEDENSDIALLKIDAEGLKHVELGDSDTVRVGQSVCTVGNPMGELSHSLAVGWISAGERTISAEGARLRVFQVDIAINSGNSGGPLFDESGRVIAMVTAKYSGASDGTATEGLGFAIPINAARSLTDAWVG